MPLMEWLLCRKMKSTVLQGICIEAALLQHALFTKNRANNCDNRQNSKFAKNIEKVSNEMECT